MTNEEKMELVNKVTKGNSQYWLIRDLILTGITGNFGNYMKAQSYYSNYVSSYLRAISRLQKLGVKVNIQLGKNGGHWTAVASLAA